MNVFVIPSWYPSDSNPIYGTFVHEQCRILSRCAPGLNQGISLWGQGDDRFLLWSRQPVRSIGKLLTRYTSSQKNIKDNLVEYYQPAFTWTRKIAHGNIRRIVRANEKNLRLFEREFGKVDLIHAQASYAGAVVAHELSKKWGVPYIVTIRMSPFPFAEFLDRNGRIINQIDRPLQGASRLIATSTSLQRSLVEFGYDNSVVIHNPVDIEFFNKTRDSDRSDKESLKLITVGRLEPQKGYDLLIEAVSLIKHKLDFTLEIIGEGSQREILDKLIHRFELGDIVNMRGECTRHQVRDQIKASDALILSSRHETFGNVLLEAMACGNPVLATRCGGPTDIVTRETGILVEKENVEALCDGILTLNSHTWDSDVIREEALARFGPEIFTKRILRLYSSVLDET